MGGRGTAARDVSRGRLRRPPPGRNGRKSRDRRCSYPGIRLGGHRLGSPRVPGCLRTLIVLKRRPHLSGPNYVGSRREAERPAEAGNRNPRSLGKGAPVKPAPKHEQPTEQPTRFAGPSAPKTGPLPIDTSAGSGRCQVRAGTDFPCGRPAVAEVLGVPFCGRCAREQEDYFVVGELTQVPRGRRVGTTSLGHDDTGMRRPSAPAGRQRS